MKKLNTLIIASVLAGASITPSALALTVNMERGSFQGAQGGGEFVALTSPESYLGGYSEKATQKVTNNAGNQQVGFSTFCLEEAERVNFEDTYAGVLNQRAINGGTDLHDPVGAGPFGDPISLATAYLYSEFAKGTLASYAYGDGTDGYSPAEIDARKASATLLQSAIWYFEDEITLANPSANIFIDAALDEFGGNAFAASNGAYGVSAINLTLNGARRQDVLVYDPSKLPDTGATLVMLGGGLLGLSALRRRKA